MPQSQILVVEDETIIAMDIQSRLLDLGYESRLAGSGEEAVSKAVEAPPDLILMDIVLPGKIDGIEAAGQIRELFDIPVVFLTAYSDKHTLERAKQTGPFGYLLKPLKDRDLYTAIEMATYKHKIEMQLRESEDRYRDLVENSQELICTHDLDGRILSANRAAAEGLGYELENCPENGNLRDFIAEDEHENFESYLQTIVQEGAARGLFALKTTSGTRRLLEYNNTLRTSGVGAPIVRGMARDVTDVRRAEQEREKLLAREKEARAQAEEASRLKDEFLSTLSHELRTPLTAIQGWAYILRQENLDAATVRKAVEVIDRNAKAQTRIVEDILDVSRIITGKFQVTLEPVRLASTVYCAVDSVRPTCVAKSIKLNVQNEIDIEIVSGDPNRLQQIAWNLLSNAIKFTNSGGEITVSLTRNGSFAQIVVTDTGIGIDSSFLPYVFDRFRHAGSSGARSHEGLGLGLASVRHLVTLHGGTVNASSEGRNLGATFTVSIPLLESETGHEAQFGQPASIESCSDKLPMQAPSDLTGLRILVVEDNNDVREIISSML